MKKGFFITFEGPEGSGKSTHSKRLCNFLKKRGYPVLHLREPGGTKISEAIRKILLAKKNREMDIKTEMFLYLASRAQLVKEKIVPALNKGRVVILDRFQDSTLAYQGYGGGISLSFLDKLGRFVTGGLEPDLTFFLDIGTKEGLKRSGYKDRMEKKSFAFHQRVRRGYRKLVEKNSRRFFAIKADRDIDTISKTIQKKIMEIISR